MAGVKITEDVAMTFSAFWAATMLLSCSGAMLPLNLMRRVKGGGSQIADDDERHWLINSSPNLESTPMAFRASRMGMQINCGNGFAEIARNRAGMAKELHPIHSARIPPQTNIKRGPDGKLFYRVNNNDGSKTDLSADDVLHVPSPISDDGIIGKGVVTQARLSISLGIATEKRSPEMKNVPTLKEQGVAVDYAVNRGLMAPKGTPGAILAKLESSCQAAAKDPGFAKAMHLQGTDVRYMGRKEYGAWLKEADKENHDLAKDLALLKR